MAKGSESYLRHVYKSVTGKTHGLSFGSS
nr:hypothetical protein [Streptococcus panodentis]